MTWIPTLLGALLVALTLRDAFHTLWHPSGEGTTSRVLSRLLWRAGGRMGRRGRELAGPLLLVGVVVVWTVLVITGFALVYWPRMDSGFAFSPGLAPGARSDLLDAVYLSTVVTGTLGFGDVVARDGWLRMVTAGQGLVGFALLTAALSWVLQTQQILGRRRSLARLLSAHRRGTEETATVPSVELLDGLARDLARTHVDLGQSASTYYFHERDETSALALALPHAADLARRARGSDDPDRRAAARMLDVALDDYAALLGERFVASGPRAQVLDRYARDQGFGPD
ncbi:potassium channel family protein [Cellulomonas sp. ATA003]|uniref:potassium channel family protein n=1 Tax=Cellulomonas sp. ATA003 TaxID=3073064 RepID=UPI002872F77E|nr:potassium channel family protein [Cellulomonas sp. ATA003]WNB87092.1 potassium channel family protein [Cellulomonas sp. ATA003]